MALNEQWNLKSRAHACHASGRPFVEGEKFFTALFDLPDSSGLERRDYSEEAWHARSADESEPFSHWRSVYTPPARAPKQEDPVHRESAEELLRRLVQEDEAHTENARFILAVMLERQKLLRQTDVNKIGETRILIYEHRKTGEVLLVRDPDIPLADVDRVTAEVTALLEAESPAAETDEAAASAEIGASGQDDIAEDAPDPNSEAESDAPGGETREEPVNSEEPARPAEDGSGA